MDPNACADRIADAILHADPPDFTEAAEATTDLIDWLDGGGFAPDAAHVRRILAALFKVLLRVKRA